MNLPPELKYSKTHEWVRVEEDLATIGITDYAQDQLGDVVYIELPDVGRTIHQDEEFGSVESVKAVSPLIAPVGGEIVEINEELTNKPELVNQDPYGEAWLIKFTPSDASELSALMDAGAYEKFVAQEMEAGGH